MLKLSEICEPEVAEKVRYLCKIMNVQTVMFLDTNRSKLAQSSKESSKDYAKK